MLLHWLATRNGIDSQLICSQLYIYSIFTNDRFHDGNLSLDMINLRWLLLFFIKWEHWAVLEIWKCFFQGGGCACTLSPQLMDEVLCEERQLMKWVGIFQVGIFGGNSGGNFPRTMKYLQQLDYYYYYYY